MSQIAFLKRELEEARERKRRAQDEILVLERLLARHDPDWDIPLQTATPAATPAKASKPSHEERNATFEREWRAVAHYVHQNNGCSGTDLINDLFPHLKDSARYNRINRAVAEKLIRKSGNGRSVRYFKVKGAVIPDEGGQLTLPTAKEAPKKKPKPKPKKKKKNYWKDGPMTAPANTEAVVAAFKKHGELTHSDLVKKSKVSSGGTSWVLKWLEKQDQLQKRTDGVYAYYSLKGK